MIALSVTDGVGIKFGVWHQGPASERIRDHGTNVSRASAEAVGESGTLLAGEERDAALRAVFQRHRLEAFLLALMPLASHVGTVEPWNQVTHHHMHAN